MMLSPRPPTCTRAPSSWPESRPCLPGHRHAIPSQGWGRGLPILSRDSLSCRLRAEGVVLQDPQLLWPDADPRSCLQPPPHRPDPRPRTWLGADVTFTPCSDCPPHPTSHARRHVFPCPHWTPIWHPGQHIMVLGNGRWEGQGECLWAGDSPEALRRQQDLSWEGLGQDGGPLCSFS